MVNSEAEIRRALELYETAPVGLCEVNEACVITAMNRTLLTWLGYSQADTIGRMSFAGLVSDGTRAHLDKLGEQCRQGQTAEGIDLNLRCQDGVYWLQARVSAVGVHDAQGAFHGWRASVREVTREREVQRQLLQMRTLAAIERLAEGMANELNNQLQIVVGYAELGLEQLEPSLRRSSDLFLIKEAAFRAAETIRRLQALSVPRTLEKIVLDLNVLLLDLFPSLRSLMPPNTQLRVVTCPEGARIAGDPVSLTQLLVNLVAFAREDARAGGTLALETSHVILDEEYCRQHPAVTPGKYVCLTATDMAESSDPASFAHILEPFLGREEVGNGLRFSVMWGIVKRHEGYVDVLSSPDEGTIVRIYLPCEGS
jgi:PAS domain S-box-containing protein